MPKNLFSLEIEKHVLGGLIRHPSLFPEVDGIIKDDDFYNELHRNIFYVIRSLLRDKKPVDKVIVSEKLKNLNIHFEDEIDPFQYIDDISYIQIQKDAFIEAIKELGKIRVRRDLQQLGREISNLQVKNGEKGFDEIIGDVDEIYNRQILSYYIESEPENIFENMADFIEEIGNNPVEEIGIPSPYKNFNELYGGFKSKNIYAFVARSGHGKSTLLYDIGFKCCRNSDFKTKFLFLDTEMETADVKLRAISSLTGVSMWDLESGNWRKDENKTDIIRQCLKDIKGWEIHHKMVGNKTIDEVCSIVRRWYYLNFGRASTGKEAIIAYDYIKLTGEKISDSWKEHQIIGEKVDKLKKLAESINAPILTACQVNRTGENQNRKKGNFSDDSSIIAQSDRLLWYASFVSIFRKKTLEELEADGMEFGTHKMINLKGRFQGRLGQGHDDSVRRKNVHGDTYYESNYINFEVTNFNVCEKGTLLDVVERENGNDTSIESEEEKQKRLERQRKKAKRKEDNKGDGEIEYEREAKDGD